MKNSKEPAFPFILHEGTEDQWTATGLTKREYFAIKTLQGFCSSDECFREWDKKETIVRAISYADELLKQLSDEKEKNNS